MSTVERPMYLGIDLGTSELKIVLLAPSGQVEGTARMPLQVSRPRPLWSEQTPQDWWRALDAAMAQLAQSHPAALRAVRGIGLSGQMHGAVLLDADDHVRRPAILWNDGRSAAQCAALMRNVPRRRRRQRGQRGRHRRGRAGPGLRLARHLGGDLRRRRCVPPESGLGDARVLPCAAGRWHQMSVMLAAAGALDWAARLTGQPDVGALLASVLGIELEVHEGNEAGGALGAARLGWLAAGGELAEVCRAPGAPTRVHRPDPALAPLLRERHARFRALYPALVASFHAGAVS